MPVEVHEKTTGKKKKGNVQKENDEEFVTPRKKSKASAVDSPTGSFPSSKKKKRKKEKQTPTNGRQFNAEENDNLANGVVESAVGDESVHTSQSNTTSSSKKRRKSKASDSPATSVEVSSESVAEDVNSSLRELTKKRRSLAAQPGEQDTPGTARKRKKNVTSSTSI